MKTYAFTVNGKSDAGTLTWNANGTLQKLAVVDGFNAGGSETCSYLYDDVGRLGVPPNSPPPPGNPTTYSLDCGSSLWRQVFSYDQYNNLTKTGNPGSTWNPGYNSANNRYSTIGATYDLDGHITYDSFNTYTWDAYGKMSSTISGTSAAVCGTSGTCVTYDASGRAVENNVSGTYSEILYSPLGKTAIMSGASTVTQSYIPLPGGMSMIASGSGGQSRYIEHHDWLGTVRLSTVLIGRSLKYDRAFAPYGETYDAFGGLSFLNFAGERQDIFIGLFDTPNRELATNASRWLSPDPARASWNAYSYPTNPNSLTDPSGLWTMPCPGACWHGAGGVWSYGPVDPFDYVPLADWNAGFGNDRPTYEIGQWIPGYFVTYGTPDCPEGADPCGGGMVFQEVRGHYDMSPVGPANNSADTYPGLAAFYDSAACPTCGRTLRSAAGTMNDWRTYAAWYGASALVGLALPVASGGVADYSTYVIGRAADVASWNGVPFTNPHYS